MNTRQCTTTLACKSVRAMVVYALKQGYQYCVIIMGHCKDWNSLEVLLVMALVDLEEFTSQKSIKSPNASAADCYFLSGAIECVLASITVTL